MKIEASSIAKLHTWLASAAFVNALVFGVLLHYKKIVKNDVAGYPQEWFPSVSATIGDWYPERNIFQILIAISAGPRFALVFCWWFLTRTPSSRTPDWVLAVGLLRTLSCGGWIYITSSDQHDVHDALMIAYIILNIPHMAGTVVTTPLANISVRRQRTRTATCFFAAIGPMIYFFLQHKVQRIPGAYSKYSLFEWILIVCDVRFDSLCVHDLAALQINVSKLGPNQSVFAGSALVASAPSTQVKVMDALAGPAAEISGGKKLSTPTNSFNTKPGSGSFPRVHIPPSARSNVHFLADVYLVFMWVSVFTALPITLFYFSVWELSISGQELALLSLLSPILLEWDIVRKGLSTHVGRVSLQLILFSGLLAYGVGNPMSRLLVVTFANAAGSLLRAIEWAEVTRAKRHGIVLALGLILASLLKYTNHGNNPIWPIVNEDSGGWNKTGIFFASLAIWDYSSRSSSPYVHENSAVQDRPPKIKAAQWILASLGLAGLLFSIHCFLTDPSTLVAWTWTGYPVSGPTPAAHGFATVISQCIGALLALSPLNSIVRHPAWAAVGAISAYLLYAWKDWKAYAAGQVFACFLISTLPEIMHAASLAGRFYPGRVYFTTWLFVSIFYLAHVWVVAYAFVPAGWILRERTDIVLASQTVAILCGLGSSWKTNIRSRVMTSSQRAAVVILVSLMILSPLGAIYRTPTVIPLPHNPTQRLITAGIWTVHFGIDLAGRDTQRRMRDLIGDMKLDIVGLLETDLHRIVFGNRDLTRVIAEDLGYYVDPGPGPNSHTWGAVLLSKFPILLSRHHLLPSPQGELAPAISAVLDVWGVNVTVVVSHNGQEEDAQDRELQSIELARIMNETYPDPVIFLGYVVTQPKAPRPNPYTILVEDGRMHDIDEEDWDRWCEYIMYRGLYRVGYARVSRSTITDTELQIGKFIVPKAGHIPQEQAYKDRYDRCFREVLEPSIWFPDDYMDAKNPGGKRGHMYHVHPWPFYYRPPSDAVV